MYHIIGGGIIGLCSAWYLHKAGYPVTVIDKSYVPPLLATPEKNGNWPPVPTDQDACSIGNSGIIVPSHSAPIASPGVIAQGIKWMFKSSSPFFIQPRLDPDLLRWLWRFYRSCNKAHVDRAMPLLRDCHLMSKALFKEFASTPGFAFDLEEHGSLMLYRTAQGEHEEMAGAEKARSLGLNVSIFSPEQIAAHDPHMRCDVRGGVHYHDDAHLYPGKFVFQLQQVLSDAGVKFVTHKAVSGFKTSGHRVTELQYSDGSKEQVDEVVLAAGSWSGKLGKHLGLGTLIQDGKGYSMTLKNANPRPALPSILTEARVAVTPMGNDLRIGGTLEVSNFSPKINMARVQAILDAMSTYYPDFPRLRAGGQKIWYGYRPVSADGLPYIGRTKKYRNLIVAAGHAMIGVSLGPVTGLLVSEIAQGKASSLPIDLFNPERHA